MPQFFDRRLRFIGTGLALALVAGELHQVPHHFFEVIAPGHEKPVGSIVAIPNNSTHPLHTHSHGGPQLANRTGAGLSATGPTGAAFSPGFMPPPNFRGHTGPTGATGPTGGGRSA
jgi:hypothetical protein